MNGLLFIFSLLYFNYAYSSHLNTPKACGGFIKWSKKDLKVPIDYTKLNIELISHQNGLLKERANVLPKGIFTIPIYEPGEYWIRLSTPPGWSFSPSDGFKFDVGADKDSCNENFVFLLNGYSVSGKVVTEGLTSGVPDLHVTLVNKQSQNIVGQSKTVGLGEFSIKDVYPGSYEIYISDNPLSSTELVQSIRAKSEGHKLFGRIKFSYSNQNHDGARVYLFKSKSDIPLRVTLKDIGCLKDEVKTDSNGQFAFPRLPGGNYLLQPMLKQYSKDSVLHLEEETQLILMEHNDIEAPDFVISKVSTFPGKVMWPSNKPISEAKVFMNGEFLSKTSVDGSFPLNKVPIGEQTFTIEAENATFEKFVVKFNEDMKESIRVKPSKLSLCVHFVWIDQDDIKLPHIDVFNKADKSVLIDQLTPNRVGESSAAVCSQFSPANYLLKLSRVSTSLPFAPGSIEVQLNNEPVINGVVFSLLRLSISGGIQVNEHVESFEGVEVVLETSDSGRIVAQTSTEKFSKEKFIFRLDDLLPGDYVLKINGLPKSLLNRSCWISEDQLAPITQLKRRIQLIDKDLNEQNTPALKFVIRGSLLDVALPSVVLHYSDGVMLTQKLKNREQKWFIDSTTNQICVDDLPVELKFHSDCFKFKPAKLIGNTIRALLDSVSLTALIYPNDSSVIAPKQSCDLIQLAILNLKDQLKNMTKFNWNDGGEASITFWSEVLDEGLSVGTFKPIAKNKVKPDTVEEFTFSFKPQYIKFALRQDREADVSPTFQRVLEKDSPCGCASSEKLRSLEFTYSPGVYLSGSVKPAVNYLKIKVLQNEQVVYEDVNVNLDKNGRFRVGTVPLPSNNMKLSDIYDIEIQKLGYTFAKSKSWDFVSRKLAVLNVRVTTVAEKSPLSGMLISILGEDGYRGNQMTDNKGSIIVIGLKPGEYYVQPMMKEYGFRNKDTKAAKDISGGTSIFTVKMKEGETVSIEIEAVRTAYSAFGAVSTLSRKTLSGILVQSDPLPIAEQLNSCPMDSDARKMLKEQIITDEDGSFKIRGLNIGCAYRITIRSTDKFHVEKSLPAYRDIVIKKEDFMNANFMVIRRQHMGMISGMFHTPPAFLNQVHLILHPLGHPSNVLMKHSFFSDSKLFLLTGKQLASMPDLNLVIRLEHTLNPTHFGNLTNPQIVIKRASSDKSISTNVFHHFNFDFYPTVLAGVKVDKI